MSGRVRMSGERLRGLGRGVVLLGAAIVSAGLAATVAYADTPSATRAARLTFTEGYVHVDRVSNVAGDPAQINMPLVEGQSVVTGEDGQAEVEFEDGSVARVTPNSVLRLARLAIDGSGHYTTQVGLVKGLAYFELRSAARFSYTVEAAGDVVSPAENTIVRVNLDEPPAAVAVLDGTVNVERAGGYRVDVRAGETFRSDISGTGRYFLTQEVASDTWDQWNEARDQAAADAAPKQTTARDGFAGNQGYGWSDLDANGSWYNVPGQGEVWQPQGGDDASFDPYGNGSWIWNQGAGYTWASGYAWGWTPYRCGGWSYWNTFGWGWSPNAACGGFGFAGYGGYGYGYGGGYGGVVNIVLAPRNYPIRHIPGGGGPGVHPILRVSGGTTVTGGQRDGQSLQGPRRIAGVVATPLRPVGASYVPHGGSALGASLRSDYPVDRTTHAPVLGLQSTHSAVQTGYVGGTVGRAGIAQGYNGRTVEGSGSVRPGFQQGLRPSAPSGYQGSGAGYQQGLRPSSPSMQGSYARPGVQQSAPHYSAPQVSHPSYSAPAAAQSHSAPAPSAAPAAAGHK